MPLPTSMDHTRITENSGSLPTKVLVVDDDNETTELLKVTLEPLAFEVIATNSAQEAIHLVRDQAPDVMVVDLLMPEMDGMKVCEEVRKFSTIPILMLSAVNRPDIMEKALDLGADDYLSKPMKSSVLVAHLHKLLRRARPGMKAIKGNGRF